MMRHLSIAIGLAATLVLSSSSSFAAEEAKFGSEQEAKAMLEKAVAALKDDKAKALAMFNKGEGGFKDRDLYVFCANASDGVMTAHPYLKGELLQDIVGKKGFPLGKAIMETAAEGKIQSVTYWWPRPGTETFSCATTRPFFASQMPRRMKGIAVAATYHLALRPILASGSQRNSCEERKSVRTNQIAREPSGSSILTGLKLLTIASFNPCTR